MIPTAIYAVPTAKGTDEALAAVEAALKERGFSVLWHLDMRETLRQKGQPFEPEFHVLEVCSAPRAKQALETNIEVGFLLPCTLTVYSDPGDGDRIKIGLLRPESALALLGDPRLNVLAAEVERQLREAVAAAAG